MLLHPATVGDWLGLSSPVVFRLIGAGLILFAAHLIHQSFSRRMATWMALTASAGDLLWVVATVLLLAIFPQVLSPMGNALVLGVALAVLGFGCWQLWGIVQVHRVPGTGLYRHCIRVEVNVPAAELWQVVGQLDKIKDYMPSLKRSVLLDDQIRGVGAVRVCEDHAGKRWAAQCTAYTVGKGFEVQFLADAEDFPFPAKSMRGGWEVEEIPGGSVVMVWWELEPASAFTAAVVLPLLAFQVDRRFPEVIGRMASAALGRDVEQTGPATPVAIARLLPTAC